MMEKCQTLDLEEQRTYTHRYPSMDGDNIQQQDKISVPMQLGAGQHGVAAESLLRVVPLTLYTECCRKRTPCVNVGHPG